MTRSDAVAPESISRLHPSSIEDQEEIVALLTRLSHEKVELRRGMNRRIDPERIWIERVDQTGLLVRTRNLEPTRRNQIFLNFSLDARSYFFSTPIARNIREGRLYLEIPAVIYHAERRDRVRREPQSGDARRVALGMASRWDSEVEVVDFSPDGLAVCVPKGITYDLGSEIDIRFLEGSRVGERLYAEVRNIEPEPARVGWARMGLSVSSARRGAPLATEWRKVVIQATRFARAQQRWKVMAAGLRVASDRALVKLGGGKPGLPEVKILDYTNREGESLRAIVDSWGPRRGAPAVVMAPAWGRTKETLMPLAKCIVETFRKAREPIAVVRFDGIRKRGESYNDPDCRAPERDHHRFTFSQGVRDIRATLDFLQDSPEFKPPIVILVSFSAAAIEARKAVATDERIAGWISVVGAGDLQAMMRVISGGGDAVGGLERGVRFGLQEVLGIEVDIDHAGFDAFQHELAYLEDSRRDMAAISVPITWIHGRYDAWMNPARARDVLSRGDTKRRRFIEVPTGHTLKTSKEALDVFQLVSGEIGRMILSRPVRPCLPNLAGLERWRVAERTRLPEKRADLRSFWRDYLLGKDRTLGMELMTSITPYERLMDLQVEALSLCPGDRVADLGSGTGAFPLSLARRVGGPRPIHVYEIDYVREGLRRAQARLEEAGVPPGLEVHYIESNLDRRTGGSRIPLRSGSLDAVLGALLLCYLSDPEDMLREIQRVLRPGGRVAFSTMKRDADMSKLYTEGVDELRSGRAREILGREAEKQIGEATRGYLNLASQLLDLEEAGTFRFWDPPEFARLVRRGGFRVLSTRRALGDPPQVVVLAAERA